LDASASAAEPHTLAADEQQERNMGLLLLEEAVAQTPVTLLDRS